MTNKPMNQPYSNTKATLAIAKASFRSIIRSPSSVVFTLLFPLIFILVFGFISGGGVISVDVGVAKTNDTLNPVYRALKAVKVVRLIHNQTPAEMDANLKKGSIDAILDIQKSPNPPYFIVNIQHSQASGEKANILKSTLNNIFYQINTHMPDAPPPAAIIKETEVKTREYKTIDFILPGQLGFSLLSTGVFGTAFVFLSLRITLVIKRFFCHPGKALQHCNRRGYSADSICVNWCVVYYMYRALRF
jgi:ABC-2 type transport system permease protein